MAFRRISNWNLKGLIHYYHFDMADDTVIW